MYIMRKMNREKRASTDAEREALLADGYRDVSPDNQHENIPAEKEDPVTRESVKKTKEPAKKAEKKQQEPDKAAVVEQTAAKAAAPELSQVPAGQIPAEAAEPADQAPAKTAEPVQPEKKEG